MLKQIYAENFRSWEKLNSIDLGKVTLFFGENSSGKTSIIKLILLLKQTVESYDRAQPLNLGTRDSLVELGLYEELIYSHDTKLFLKFGIKWEIPKLKDNNNFAFIDLEFRYISNSIRVASTNIGLEDLDNKVTNAKLTRGTRGGYELFINGRTETELGMTKDLAPIKCYGFPPLATQLYPKLNDLSLAVDQLAKRIYYLGPLRVSPEREYLWSGSAPEGVGRSGETAIQAVLANIFERRSLKKSERDKLPDLVAATDRWLKKMNLADSFEVKQISGRQYKAVLNVPDFHFSANVADVGVGVSQVLPIVILAHFVPEGSIIILEQPELHLHPSVQAVLAEFFYEISHERNIQFIIETHSEYLLTRLQRRLAERKSGELSEEEVKLYVCRREKDHSEIDRLHLDDSGRIINWPPHFFGDTVTDKEAIMRAYIQKRLNNKDKAEDHNNE